jgi:hypothetical protein
VRSEPLRSHGRDSGEAQEVLAHQLADDRGIVHNKDSAGVPFLHLLD